ncbi:hypothetical protein AU190_17045 [Mycolicibacterium acapulense]|nr:hypothetical protein AU190_17045 [Mycolicibacterium acapulense]
MSVAVGAALVVAAPTQAAQLHRVTYTVTADNAAHADIYYRDVDPPSWADYSHNPYQFSPKAEVRFESGQSWVLEVMLADPRRWAMVAATPGGMPPKPPMFRCELAVDGVVVRSTNGARGALCSLRHW